MKRTYQVVLGLSLLCLSLSADTTTAAHELGALRDGSCSPQQAATAEKLAPTVQSWDKLYSLFMGYAHCDEGAVAARFTEAVSQVLLNRWDRVSDVRRLSAQRPEFQQFVIRHVDETVPAERLRALNELATRKCPPSDEEFCQVLVERLRGL